jgi:hypothetical protein
MRFHTPLALLIYILGSLIAPGIPLTLADAATDARPFYVPVIVLPSL